MKKKREITCEMTWLEQTIVFKHDDDDDDGKRLGFQTNVHRKDDTTITTLYFDDGECFNGID